MSLILMESCDLPGVAGSKWDTIGGSVLFGQTQETETCWSLEVSDDDQLIKRFDDDESSTVTLGFRHNWDGFGNNPNNAWLTFLGDAGTTSHITVELIDNSDTVAVYRGGTQLTTASLGISTNTWHYIEVQVTIADSGGRVIVKRDNTTIIDYTGDTRNGGTDALCDTIYIGQNAAANRTYIRDIYLLNDAGATLNDFLGPVTVEARLVNADGNYTQWTPNSGDNYAAVDDPAANDGDTTYVESSAAAERDSYALPDLSTIVSNPRAVQAHCVGKYTTTPVDVAMFIRRASTDADGTAETPNAAYASLANNIWETDPILSGDWTLGNVNAIEIGIVSS